jgi:hypothetical protein
VDVSNVLEQEFAPAIFQYKEAVMPEINSSAKTKPDELFSNFNRQITLRTSRIFRHVLRHETSCFTLDTSYLVVNNDGMDESSWRAEAIAFLRPRSRGGSCVRWGERTEI